MNRDFTQEELDCIKELFTEDEFNNIIYKIKNKIIMRQERIDKEKLMNEIREIEGTKRVDLINNSDNDLYKTIIYDYKTRRDIKIFFELHEYGMRIILKTRNYGFSTQSINDLIEKLPIIHKGIEDGII